VNLFSLCGKDGANLSNNRVFLGEVNKNASSECGSAGVSPVAPAKQEGRGPKTAPAGRFKKQCGRDDRLAQE
jgi:hypothetical protein